MALPTPSKAALHHARGHKTWGSADDDALDTAASFDFVDTTAFITSTAGVGQATAPADHPPNFGGALTGADIPASQLDASAAIVIPTMQAGPTHSINESNLDELPDHLNREGEHWAPGTTLLVRFPQSVEEIPEYFRNYDEGLDDESDVFEGTYGFVPEELQPLVMQALATWSDVANIQFREAEPDEEADFYFYGIPFAPAYSSFTGASSGISDHGTRIVINNGSGWPDIVPGTRVWETLVHERPRRAVGREVGILQDIPGPKLRLGPVEDGVCELHQGSRAAC